MADAGDPCFDTLLRAARRIASGEVSPLELTRRVLERIETLDPALHAFVTVLGARAEERAKAAEVEISRSGPRSPLHGVPIGVKDLCFTRGIRTTCASKVMSDFMPQHDATVVERLEAAGAIVVGKLHMTEFALSGYHPSYPVPRNPWDVSRHPGLSSSGSGVAVAAGLCFGAIGTDTGGSIRFPSACCGIVGLKPTWGRVSRFGVFPLAESLDHVGPMTRSVADAAAMLRVLAGADARDPTSLTDPVADYAAELARGCAGLRVGLDEKYVTNGTQTELAEAVLAAASELARAGAALVPIEMPDLSPGCEAWPVLCAAEAVAAHRATFPSRAEEYGPTFRSFLEFGLARSAADYAAAHVQRLELSGRLARVFETVDAVVCPSMPFAPLPASLLPPDAPFVPFGASIIRYTAPFDLSGSPTLSLPCGFDADDLPLSLQLVGRHLGEAALLRLGHAYECATAWSERHPHLDVAVERPAR
jgi:amidase